MTPLVVKKLETVVSPLDKEEVSPEADIDALLLDYLNKDLPDVDVRGMLLDARVRETIKGAPTLTLVLHDKDLVLLDKQVLWYQDAGGDRRVRNIRVELDERPYRLTGIKVMPASSGAGVDHELIFEHELVTYMRRHTRPRRVSRKTHNLPQFMRMLAREIKAIDVNFISPALGDRPVIEKEDSQEKKDEKRQAGFSKDARITVKGKTATAAQKRVIAGVLEGVRSVTKNRKAAVIAVMVINQESLAGVEPVSVSGKHLGPFHQDSSYGPPADRRDPFKAGAAFARRLMKHLNSEGDYGSIADKVQISGLPSEYNPWREEAEKTVRAFSGTGAESQVVYKQFNYTRGVKGKKESTWTCSQRYAELVNYCSFVTGKRTWYFISEPDLFESRPRMTIDRDGQGRPHPALLEYPSGGLDDGKDQNTIQLRVRLDRWTCPAGATIVIEGYGYLDGKWLVEEKEWSFFSREATVSVRKPTKPLPEPRGEKVTISDEEGGGGGTVRKNVGARGIVEDCVRIAQEAGGDGVYVGSDYRPGDPLDHGSNNHVKAARDIGVEGINLLTGPPSPKLDRAVVAIGKAFGRNYTSGTSGAFQNADTFHWNGYRVQIIWRTPRWGGHMGHIHVGARKL